MDEEAQIINIMVKVILETAKKYRTKGELCPMCFVIIKDVDGSFINSCIEDTFTFFETMHGKRYQFPAYIRNICRSLKSENKTPVAFITLSDVWLTRSLGFAVGSEGIHSLLPADSPDKIEAIALRVDTKDSVATSLVIYENREGKIVYDKLQPVETKEATFIFVDLPESLFPKDI